MEATKVTELNEIARIYVLDYIKEFNDEKIVDGFKLKDKLREHPEWEQLAILAIAVHILTGMFKQSFIEGQQSIIKQLDKKEYTVKPPLK